MKVYKQALKLALTSKLAQRFIRQQNDKEPQRKANNPLRPVIVWTDRSEKMTAAQRATVEKMCGLGKFSGKGFGWSILALACSFEDQAYAVVLENINGMHTIVYPNGEWGTHKAVIFRSIGDWLLDTGINVPVKKMPPSERLGFIPLEEREPDFFEASPVRISGLYDRGHFRVD